MSDEVSAMGIIGIADENVEIHLNKEKIREVRSNI